MSFLSFESYELAHKEQQRSFVSSHGQVELLATPSPGLNTGNQVFFEILLQSLLIANQNCKPFGSRFVMLTGPFYPRP